MADTNTTETRSSVLSAISNMVVDEDDTINGRLLDYLKTYSYLSLKSETATGHRDLLAALNGMAAGGGSTLKVEQAEDWTSARYSQAAELIPTPSAHRPKMMVINLARETTDRSLVEYFRRYGAVIDAKMIDSIAGSTSAVLEFANPVSVRNAVRLQHVVNGKIVTCLPYQVDSVVQPIPWTSNPDGG